MHFYIDLSLIPELHLTIYHFITPHVASEFKATLRVSGERVQCNTDVTVAFFLKGRQEESSCCPRERGMCI